MLDLPAPGVYDVSFSLSGFQTYVRTGVNLGVGFDGRVDAEMHVGVVTQSVEVSGGSPVVDTVSAATATTLQQQQLQTTPLGAGIQEMLPLATGVSMQGKPDVGDSNLAARSTIITYGVTLEPTLNVEGINITTSHDLDTGAYFDSYSLAEAEFKTSGNTADVAFPGVDMEAVMKSGSNDFHGTELGDFENPSFQANNITPLLASQGFKTTNPIKGYYYDYALDLGGRILRDKLWFYVGMSKQAVTQGQLGFVSGPDAKGCWTCGDAPPANVTTVTPGYNIRGDYQLSHSTKLIGVWMHANKFLSTNGASATEPSPSTLIQHAPDNIWKGEIQSTLSPHLLFDALFGRGGYFVAYTPKNAVAGNPSSEELSDKLLTGPNALPTSRPQTRYDAKASFSYVRGAHQLKIGTEETFEEAATKYPNQYPSGDYQLLFNNGVPFEINVYNIPVTPINRLYSQAVYATDTWSIKRLTLNLGVRWERYDAFYPSQSKPAGQFSSAASYTGKTVSVWKDLVPRIGAAWDINGNGKTVLKASFGMFGDTQGDLFANTFNPNALVTTTYLWSGPCVVTTFDNVSFTSPNTSCDVQPSYVAGLSPSSAQFVSATGGLNELINPKLKQDKTYEYVARLERQLMPNVAISFGYVYHRQYYNYNSNENGAYVDSTANGINVLRPYSAYTVPVQFTDALTGAPLTIYTYPASYSGSQFNQLELMNAPNDRPDTYNSFDASITKQYSKRFIAKGSFWVTKNHEWIQAISQSPNDDPFPIDNTWNWEARGDVAYTLPHGFQLSSYYRAQSGVPGARTEVFSSKSLLQGSVTRRMGEFGSQRGPVLGVLNVKVAKIFKIGERVQFEPDFELFNVLNTSAATSTSYLTSTFNHITGVVSPRIARIGARLSF
jgi:hypothetical protein